MKGDLGIGIVREVNVISGLPATTSSEMLERLDDEEHILGVRIVGGDHRLRSCFSTITVHPEVIDGRPGTMVIKSFVVDVQLYDLCFLIPDEDWPEFCFHVLGSFGWIATFLLFLFVDTLPLSSLLHP